MSNGNTLTSPNGLFTLTVDDDGIRLNGLKFSAILNDEGIVLSTQSGAKLSLAGGLGSDESIVLSTTLGAKLSLAGDVGSIDGTSVLLGQSASTLKLGGGANPVLRNTDTFICDTDTGPRTVTVIALQSRVFA